MTLIMTQIPIISVASENQPLEIWINKSLSSYSNYNTLTSWKFAHGDHIPHSCDHTPTGSFVFLCLMRT